MSKEQPISEESSNVSYEKLGDCAVDSALGSLDKFKDVQALQEAYVNLQSEFTRKCQRLSELEKDNCNSNEKELQPFYEKEEWGDCVKEFLANNSTAQNYASEIMAELVKDKVMASMPNSLQLAFDRVKANKYRSESELVKDPEFIKNYVLNNESIKEQIINEYLEKIKQNKSPQLINSTRTGSVGLTPFNRPADLNEAKLLAEKLFSK
ncbi:MAG TPA: hypothetical protein DD621_00025 [Clostridiales bacterium]|nr:hypothetical protein [Clostridiales bacterium]